jgi:hypothetical protein
VPFFYLGGFILRDARKCALHRMRAYVCFEAFYSREPVTTSLENAIDPHGEERGNAARLEP